MRIERRRFLKYLATGALALAGCSHPDMPVASPTPLPSKKPAQVPSNSDNSANQAPKATAAPSPKNPDAEGGFRQKKEFKLGSEKEVSLSHLGVSWAPDGHITYITTGDQRKYFISGNDGKSSNGKSYAFTTPAEELSIGIKKETKKPANLEADKTVAYKNGYAAVTSVVGINPNKPNHLFATAHYEQWKSKNGALDGANFTASVGLLESNDGGATWIDRGPIIKGEESAPPGERVTGAGQPSAIIKDGYMYVYYVDWAARKEVKHPDQIYLARAKIQGDNLSRFEFYTQNGFDSQEKDLKPIILPPNVPNSEYAALPSISFNTVLKNFICVFETNLGFCASTSVDGLNWTEGAMIFKFPQPQSERKSGNTWYSYPTLLSDAEEDSDQITGKTGFLYCSKGKWNRSSHNPVAIPFELV